MSTASAHPFSRQLLAALAAGSIVLSGLFGLATPASADEAPIEEVTTQVVEAPAEDVVVEDAPAEEAPAEETPVEEVPAEETTAEETPDDTPVDEAPEASAEEAPAEDAPVQTLVAETPVVTVSKTTGLTRDGETLTISGTGFVPSGTATNGTRPPLSGQFSGAYVVFGKFLDAWKPSAGAASSARTVYEQKWALAQAQLATAGDAGVLIAADGTWSTTITVSASEARDLAAGNYGIYTYPGSGATYAPFETFTALTFAAPAVATPTVTVSKTTGLTRDGETLTISGTGFLPSAPATNGTRPPLSGQFSGAYVVFGKFLDAWKPSAGAASSARTVYEQKWALAQAQLATAGDAGVLIAADGTWSTTITVSASEARDLAAGNYGIYTYGGSGATYAPFETYTALTFAAPVVAAPTVTVSKTTGLTRDGETLTISGTGFLPSAPATNGTRPPLSGQFSGAYVVFGKFLDAWKPSAGAAGSARTVYEQKWALAQAQLATAGDAGVLIAADGTWSTTITVSASEARDLAAGNYGIYTYGGSGATYAPFETYTALTFAAPVGTPTLTVSKTSGLNAAGEQITITATNYNADAINLHGAPNPAAKAGFYVQVGYIDSAWRPSEGAASSARSNAYSEWFANTVNMSAPGKWTENPDGTVNATWTITVTKTALDAVARPGAQLAVFTVGAGGVIQAMNEKAVPIEFAAPASAPSITVSKTSGFDAAATTPITVSGSGFTTTGNVGTRPPVAGVPAGVYVVVGKFPTVWKPSENVPAAARTVIDQKWVVPGATPPLLVGNVQYVPMAPDGTFTVTLDVKTSTAEGNYGVYTYPGGGAKNAAEELYVPISFAAPIAATTTTLSAIPASFTLGTTTRLSATVTPGAAGTITFYAGSSALGAAQAVTAAASTVSLDYTPTVAGSVSLSARFVPSDPAAFASSTGTTQVSVAAPAVAAGSLTWGIKASFRDYVTGPIAKGSIATSGVGMSGGAFVFGQASGGTFDGSTGTSNYSGSVTFTGHAGELNLVISNPVIRIDSATSGTLSINGSSFATLNLAAGSRSVNGGAVTWSGVPATLTAAGAGLFNGFYGAGTALDSLTFTIGSPSSAGGSSQVVSAYSGGRAPAETPPAAEGLTVVGTGPIVAGSEITVTGEGFQPNETDILAVIYSTPQVLSRTVTADANGVATWTGRLPKDLTGTHTLTLQGSVSRGIVIEIEAPQAAEVIGCPVEGATLTWGFKETFRSYISGSIANGEWIVANGATYETPVFGWDNGAGGYDPETGDGLIGFTGSIQFTGHAGALDTTVANPQIEFVDADTAMLLVDITGVTQSGEAVNALGVEFVELDISGAEIVDGVLSITDAPAVLTEAGATAFGTYPAGEAFDAVTLSVPLADCADEAVAAPGADEQEGDVEVTSADAPNLWWLLWVALGLVVAAIIVALVVAARRRARSAE